MKTSHNKQKGFTLLETLVAITILATSVASAMAVANKSLQSSIYSRDQTISVFLAAEGLELVHNIRDNVGGQLVVGNLSSSNWIQTLIAKCSTENGCDINPSSNLGVTNLGALTDSSAVLACGSPTGCPLYLNTAPDNSQGTYNVYSFISSGTATNFSRKIIVTPGADSSKEAKITSTVYWKGGSESYSVSENISNWHVNPNE